MITKVKDKILTALENSTVEVFDESAHHIDHNPGAHIAVKVIWPGFAGKSMIEQHQIIYKILQEELQSAIHALKIDTKVK
jgi:stress-induced morphogen